MICIVVKSVDSGARLLGLKLWLLSLDSCATLRKLPSLPFNFTICEIVSGIQYLNSIWNTVTRAVLAELVVVVITDTIQYKKNINPSVMPGSLLFRIWLAKLILHKTGQTVLTERNPQAESGLDIDPKSWWSVLSDLSPVVTCELDLFSLRCVHLCGYAPTSLLVLCL